MIQIYWNDVRDEVVGIQAEVEINVRNSGTQ